MHVVTGATGHIGSALIRALRRAGISDIRAVIQPGGDTRALSGLNVAMVEADICDPDALEKAFYGADIVYHLAGIVSVSTLGSKRMHKVNVEGTRNVLQACKKVGARLVYVSSIHAFCGKRGKLVTESSEINPRKAPDSYAQTKAQATLLVRQAAQSGVDAVVVHPTGVIGPYDFSRSNLGQLFEQCITGKLKLYPKKAGHDFVDVRDVAQGIILAGEKGKTGESYILSGHHLTIKELLDMMAPAPGIRLPKHTIPLWLALVTAPFAEAFSTIVRKPPLYTPVSIATLRDAVLTTHEKATRELGYTARPMSETIRDSLVWYRQFGYNAQKLWLRVAQAKTR